MGLLNPHLDDGALAQVWTDRHFGDAESNRSAERHLQACSECRLRLSHFGDWLESVRDDAHAEADALFPSDRLATQQAQILRRLESLEHPGRVIAFPRFAQPVAAQRLPRRPWVATAAAAGLVVGVGLGQVFHLSMSRSVDQPPSQIVAGMAPRADVPPASLPGDEAFLFDEPVAASAASVPESLQYLNAITPTSRDFDR